MRDRKQFSRRAYLAGIGSALALSGCSEDGKRTTARPPETEGRTPDPTEIETGLPGERPDETASGPDETTGPTATGDAHPMYHGVCFDTAENAVEDLGMDETGSEPIDDALNGALESGTVIEFPPGEYLIESQHVVEGLDRIGLHGLTSNRRDVRFLTPQGEASRPIDGGPSGVGAFVMENVSFDERSDDSTLISLLLRTIGDTVVRNVEFLGRTPADNVGSFGFSINAEVTEQDGVARFEQIYAGLDEPATEVTYPDGVGFLRGGPEHVGAVVLRNPVIHERNSSATRYTGSRGVLTVQGGEFVNNQNANIRLSAGNHPSKVSSVDGAYVKVDGSRDSADAVRVDSSSNGYAGAVFRNLTIEWSKETARGVIAVPEFGGHGRAEFYNCAVRNDGNGAEAPTVNAEEVSGTYDDAIILENCTFTGSGGDFIAERRFGSVIRDCCIDMPNASIEGFETTNVSSSCEESEFIAPNIAVEAQMGTTVQLSAAGSSSAVGRIRRYEWRVAGASHSGEVVTHTFRSPGTYRVALAVEGENGGTASAETDVTVRAPV